MPGLHLDTVVVIDMCELLTFSLFLAVGRATQSHKLPVLRDLGVHFSQADNALANSTRTSKCYKHFVTVLGYNNLQCLDKFYT